MKARKGAAVSIVLVTFAILIYIMIPMSKAAYELLFFQHLRERAVAISDTAAFSIAANIKSEQFSEQVIELDLTHARDRIEDPHRIIVPRNIRVDQDGEEFEIYYEFEKPYVFFKHTEPMKIRMKYRLDLDDRPTF